MGLSLCNQRALPLSGPQCLHLLSEEDGSGDHSWLQGGDSKLSDVAQSLSPRQDFRRLLSSDYWAVTEMGYIVEETEMCKARVPRSCLAPVPAPLLHSPSSA